MQKIVCLFLCLALLLTPCLSSCAENAEDEILLLDRSLARWSLAMTAQLMGNACDRLASTNPDPLRIYT